MKMGPKELAMRQKREGMADTGRLPHEKGAGGGPRPGLAELREQVAAVKVRAKVKKAKRGVDEFGEEVVRAPQADAAKEVAPPDLGAMSNPPAGFDKKDWQRKYMRDYRAKVRAEKLKKGGQP